MPYITQTEKVRLGQDARPRSTGELNYLITCAMIDYITERHDRGDKVGYALISQAISAAVEAAEEMRRRLLASYEDGKIAENGDVYPAWLLRIAGHDPGPKPTGPAVAYASGGPQPDHEPYWADRREFWGANGDKALDFRAREREEMREYEERAAASLARTAPSVDITVLYEEDLARRKNAEVLRALQTPEADNCKGEPCCAGGRKSASCYELCDNPNSNCGGA